MKENNDHTSSELFSDLKEETLKSLNDRVSEVVIGMKSDDNFRSSDRKTFMTGNFRKPQKLAFTPKKTV